MNYGPGDEVVCIDSISIHGSFVGLEAGKLYTVIKSGEAACCGIDVVDVGSKRHPNGYRCGCGELDFDLSHRWNYAWRFIKLDKLTEEQHESESITA